MSCSSAIALAHPNIAFIKYWGNRDPEIRLPSNGSLSMNLENLKTVTEVSFHADLPADTLTLNGESVIGTPLQRASLFLDLFRNLAGIRWHANITSSNNFPTSAGLASSSSAYAALAFAAATALHLDLVESHLSRLARRGSGSACRSIPSGFTEWLAGNDDSDSFARSIAPPNHWDLVDCIAIVDAGEKQNSSSSGHNLAQTSPLQNARVMDAPRRLDICRTALLQRDFEAFADIVELDSTLMHAVMMTSTPSLFYWSPASLEVMQAVRSWRTSGIPCCFTIDAGPNIHVITLAKDTAVVSERLATLPGVISVLSSPPGRGASIFPENI